MIFRNSNGHLIEINKYDYPNDQIYYEKVMKLQEEFTKCNYIDKKIIIKDLFHDNISNISLSNQVNKICKFIKLL
jgi:hypothetical protein